MGQLFNLFVQLDGYAFLVIGLIVLFNPSPQPGLVKRINSDDLPPFSQTRRLLAAMFVASALLLIVLGRNVTDHATLNEVGIARIVSFVLIIILNILQLRSKRWKATPLVVLIAVFTLFTVGYAFLIANH